MKLLIHNRVYESLDRKYIDHLLSETREIFVSRNQFAIYALEQKEYIEFTNNVFKSKKELMTAVSQLTRKGFKVHYTTKGAH